MYFLFYFLFWNAQKVRSQKSSVEQEYLHDVSRVLSLEIDDSFQSGVISPPVDALAALQLNPHQVEAEVVDVVVLPVDVAATAAVLSEPSVVHLSARVAETRQNCRKKLKLTQKLFQILVILELVWLYWELFLSLYIH